MIEAIAAAFDPWKSLYSDSIVVSTTVTTIHILSLLIAGGLAIAADRSTLRALGRPVADRQAQLNELHDVHRPVLIALAVLNLSGLAMAAADVEVYAASWLFWVKMGLVAMLLLNGLFLYWTEQRLLGVTPSLGVVAPLWRRLELASQASLALWAITTIAGAVLPSVA